MNKADAITLFRTAMVFLVAYLVLIRFNAYATIAIIAIMFILDFVDGYVAKMDLKKGKKLSWYGKRLDVAGDRVTEYVLWILFTFLGIVPLFILFLIVLRHSFADALMGAKGTSSKMKSRLARIFYTSNASRGGIGIVKFITFSYLSWAYITDNFFGRYLLFAYALIGILFVYIMVRGAAEIYEAVK
jgi:phosphatidylglycerophosphate synthase